MQKGVRKAFPLQKRCGNAVPTHSHPTTPLAISQGMIIEQQKSIEIVLSKESLYDRNIVIDMKKL